MSRLRQLQLGIWLVLGLLLLRLTQLQLIRGASYRKLAEQNRLRVVLQQAPRGGLLDRHGRVLAANQTVFHVALIPQELRDVETVLERVSAMTDQPVAALRRAFDRAHSLPFLPATIAPRVPKAVAIRLEGERWRLPGLIVQPAVVRDYPMGRLAAQVVGHLSQPTAEELPRLKTYGVRPTHLVGRMGLERLLDQALRGESGGDVVEVDHRARQVRVVGRRAPEPGVRVELSLDAGLQSLLEEAFGEQAGAAVVLDPWTGEVLAMASVPAFLPEAFAIQDARAVRAALEDPRSPLLNRATQGVYQPGSIIKLITAAAALEAGVITSSTTITCGGRLVIGDRVFHCWNRDGHGPLALREAILQSCNVYFMQVSRRLGRARLVTALQQVGLSRPTGWPLEEHAGHLPDRRLSEGEVALLGMGQGEILVTVLQSALMAGLFATDGLQAKPWVVRAIGGRSAAPGAPVRRLGWSTATFAAVRSGMEAVIADSAGTGHRAHSPHVRIAGKTGTAQTHRPGQSHGWFVGFCPVERPRAALAIVAEYGGSGGDLPADIARAACEYLSP
jgi:penicillin-binding protein 2